MTKKIDMLWLNNKEYYIRELKKYDDCFCLTSTGVSTVQLNSYNSFEYSVDAGYWNAFNTNTAYTLQDGDKIYIRSKSTTPIVVGGSFVMSGSIAASGNVNYLLCKNSTDTVITSGFAYLFSGCTSLTTAPELPSTTLNNYCYQSMFQGCTGLTTAPELPATTLASYCYDSMFSGCTGITATAGLPATTLARFCCQYMFDGCTSLTTAPDLPATTLVNCCYSYMFSGCTSLTTPPELPATRLAQSCYYRMFSGCTSLAILPYLNSALASGADCYQMFYGCTNVKLSETQTAEYVNEYPIQFTRVCPQTLDDMFAETGGTFTGTPQNNTTYYTSNTVI